MKYLINNLVDAKIEIFDIEQEAITKNQEIVDAFLARESYRFAIAKEVADGNNTTWTGADLDNDPEDGEYQVFNTLTGLHEKVQGLSSAIARREEIKQDFVSASNLLVCEISDEEAIKYTPVLTIAE